jgi:hypothetical protein
VKMVINTKETLLMALFTVTENIYLKMVINTREILKIN